MAELPKVDPFGMRGFFFLGVDFYYLTELYFIVIMIIKGGDYHV